ncbi:type VII toxin-antitoxin system MntA family adenylyltransferase antitoxin [Vulcanisaeta souniana]|uniref:Polymerase beta nucleotidyltransferase domain-containing protein n=1 Tax=Vulcanisaeta souniana JCM 11219 TaxID=1293586 RepID=A0A830E0C1_9CREN|nr:HepT-like ribonuclease domain-containing protein [Vulcanisaeta souniana]BDR91829.1 hypothetical protein Vsou_09220 [Vulcanisaeta souniana JCM 11219]GGI70003.1 hypothetical protein GCM10007112_03760 [Vulcanisaeta souniana JCM 11219]
MIWRGSVIINDRLAMARSYVNILRSIRDRVRSIDDLNRDLVLKDAVERYLHLAVESLIDVGMRLCSILNLSKPERYRDIARILMNANILSDETGRLFELWIGFRNVLVHGYAVIDPERLIETLNEIDELDRVINEISNFIRDKSIDPADNQSINSSGELTNLINKARQVLERLDFVVFTYVFGSRAIGRVHPGSDIDIAIFTNRELSWKEFVSVMITLEDVLGLKVDLVHLNKAPLLLTYEAVSRGVLILDRDPERRINFEVKMIKEFLDLKPRLARYYSTLLTRG